MPNSWTSSFKKSFSGFWKMNQVLFQRPKRDAAFSGIVSVAKEISVSLRKPMNQQQREELAKRVARISELSQSILEKRAHTIESYSPKIQKAFHFINRVAKYANPSLTQEKATSEIFTPISETTHNLEGLFQKVNREYFNGELAPASLHWSPRVSLNRLGYYAVGEDRIVISKSLRSTSVPAYVIEFILFHECLHKVLGSVTIRGKRHFHTSEFRALEKTFRYYTEAEAFLQEGLYRLLPNQETKRRTRKISEPRTDWFPWLGKN
jgi:hypothetical protein